MKIDIVTIFPDFFRGPMDYGIIRRAREAGLVTIEVHDLRAFARDKHRTVDDRPFGGGEGMVLKPEPLFEAVESLLGHNVGDATRPPPNLFVPRLFSCDHRLGTLFIRTGCQGPRPQSVRKRRQELQSNRL